MKNFFGRVLRALWAFKNVVIYLFWATLHWLYLAVDQLKREIFLGLKNAVVFIFWGTVHGFYLAIDQLRREIMVEMILRGHRNYLNHEEKRRKNEHLD